MVNGRVFARRGQALQIATPIGAYQLQGSQAAYDAVGKTREIHPGEANGLVIGNIPNPPIRRQNRDPKLVPFHRFGGSVAKGHRGFVDIGDVILPDLHLAGKKVHPVFKIIFGLGQGIVVVEVFGIGHVGGRCGIGFRGLLVGG